MRGWRRRGGKKNAPGAADGEEGSILRLFAIRVLKKKLVRVHEGLRKVNRQPDRVEEMSARGCDGVLTAIESLMEKKHPLFSVKTVC